MWRVLAWPKVIASKLAAGFFGLPTWYEYLPKDEVTHKPKIQNINDIWLIAAAVLDMLVKAAGLIAVGLIIYNGFMLITSQGNPERVARARTGLLQAVVGLVIVIISAGLVSLVAAAIRG